MFTLRNSAWTPVRSQVKTDYNYYVLACTTARSQNGPVPLTFIAATVTEYLTNSSVVVIEVIVIVVYLVVIF